MTSAATISTPSDVLGIEMGLFALSKDGVRYKLIRKLWPSSASLSTSGLVISVFVPK